MDSAFIGRVGDAFDNLYSIVNEIARIRKGRLELPMLATLEKARRILLLMTKAEWVSLDVKRVVTELCQGIAEVNQSLQKGSFWLRTFSPLFLKKASEFDKVLATAVDKFHKLVPMQELPVVDPDTACYKNSGGRSGARSVERTSIEITRGEAVQAQSQRVIAAAAVKSASPLPPASASPVSTSGAASRSETPATAAAPSSPAPTPSTLPSPASAPASAAAPAEAPRPPPSPATSPLTDSGPLAPRPQSRGATPPREGAGGGPGGGVLDPSDVAVEGLESLQPPPLAEAAAAEAAAASPAASPPTASGGSPGPSGAVVTPRGLTMTAGGSRRPAAGGQKERSVARKSLDMPSRM